MLCGDLLHMLLVRRNGGRNEHHFRQAKMVRRILSDNQMAYMQRIE